jgi:hypothetical protein
VLLAVLDSGIDELGVLLLLGGGENQGRVGGGILGIVLVDGRKVTRVADDDLEVMLVTFSFGVCLTQGTAGDMSGGSGVVKIVGHLRCQRPSIDRES